MGINKKHHFVCFVVVCVLAFALDGQYLSIYLLCLIEELMLTLRCFFGIRCLIKSLMGLSHLLTALPYENFVKGIYAILHRYKI